MDKSIPVVICGMAGAAQGWYEAAYIELPPPLATVPSKAIKVPGIVREVRILPGLAQRKKDAPDVMRGEETLLLGAVLEKGATGILALGASGLKFFPASILGPEAIKAIRAILPTDAQLCAVGGIEAADFSTYFDIGVSGFGLGSGLYKAGDGAARVSERARAALHAYNDQSAVRQ